MTSGPAPREGNPTTGHRRPATSHTADRADRACQWRLAVFLIVLYLLTAAGRLTSLDGIAMYRTAHQLVVAGQVAVPPSPEASAGRDGRHYAKYGLGQSLVELPLVLLGHTLATLTSQPDDRLTQFWASLTNTFVSVGIVLVWWRFARDLGYTRPVATAGAVTLAGASLLWPMRVPTSASCYSPLRCSRRRGACIAGGARHAARGRGRWRRVPVVASRS